MQLLQVAVPRRISSVLLVGFQRRLPSQRSAQSLRSLSSTSLRRAVERPKLDNDALTAFKKTSTFQRLSQRPEAILSIQKFGEILQKQGIDTTSGKPPSMLQMSKLFLNSEVREAAKNLVEEFKKAGVDVNAKEIIEEMSAFTKMGGDSKR